MKVIHPSAPGIANTREVVLLALLWMFIPSCTKSADIAAKISPETPGNQKTESFADDIKLTITGATGPAAQSGTPLSLAYDGSKATLYHSSWSGTTLPQALEFTLKEDAARLDYIYLAPRSDGGNNGVILEGEIWASTRENPNFTRIVNFSFPGSGSVGIIPLPVSVINPSKIRIVVTKTDGGSEGEKNRFISLAELECWQENANKAAFLNLFTDGSCTEVKPGVARATIAAIADTALRNIGLAVFDKKTDSRRVVECQSYPDPAISAQKNKTSLYGFVDNVTGIYLSPSSDAYIFVGGTPVAPVKARVINHNNNGLSYVDYPLKAGINKFKPTAPGLVYIVYQSTTDSKLKVFLARGYVNGYFDLKKSNPADWAKTINDATTSFFDLKGEYTVVTFPTTDLKELKNADIADYIKTWDQIVYKEQEFMGLVKYNRMHKSRMYVKAVVDPSAYMYASSYFTAYQLGTIPSLNTVTELRGSSIWGPAHEIGHVNQVRPDFMWTGMTEVTNNVCSLYMQTLFNGLSASRIQDEDLGGGLTRYQKAFDRFFKNDGHNHFLDDDVFCKLVPFWQLQLYFSNVIGYTDFYKDLLEELRNQTSPDKNSAHLEFYKRCCDITRTDLTEFFTQWGLLMPFSARVEDYSSADINVTQAAVDAATAYVKGKNYAQPAMPIQYIQDNTVELYTSSARFSKGSVSVNGSSISLANCRNAVVFLVKSRQGQIVKVYPPKNNDGSYNFQAGTSDIGSIEAVDATGAVTKIFQL